MEAILRALYVAATIFGVGIITVDMLGLIGDAGPDSDGDGQDGDHGSELRGSGDSLLSFLRYVRTAVYFSVGFGPLGLAAGVFGSGAVASLLWATGGGIGIVAIARAFFRFQQRDVDSTLSDDELLFETARVTVPIAGGSMGKVRIRIGQVVAERYALAESTDEAFRGRDLVQIVRVTDECVYVKRADLTDLPAHNQSE